MPIIPFRQSEAQLSATQAAMMQNMINAEIDRAERFKRAWDRYYGKYPDVLTVKTGQPDDNIKLNFARTAVDKGVSFLFSDSVEFELDQERQTPQEDYLEEVWRANRKMTLLHKVALNGGVTGSGFIRIMERDGEVPRLIALDPLNVIPNVDPDDAEHVLDYTIQYSLSATTVKRILIRPDGSQWLITEQESDGAMGGESGWTTTDEYAFPYPFPPIVECQNLPAPNEFWGISDLDCGVLDTIRSISFVLSNLARIIRYHAHPKTVGTGFSAKDLEMSVDGITILPNSNAKLWNLEMNSDLASSITLYRELKQALHEISRIPEVATGKLENAGSLSGVALEILYQPLLELTRTKRLLYGDMLIELNRRLLAMNGMGDANYVTIHWPQVLPVNELEERQAAQIDEGLGIVSKETLSKKAGYDWDVEQQRIANEESQRNASNPVIQLLNRQEGLGVAPPETSLTQPTGAGNAG